MNKITNPPCTCISPGYCPRYRKFMLGNEFNYCKYPESVSPETRDIMLSANKRSAQQSLSKAPKKPRVGPCIHYGDEAKDESGKTLLRECASCNGKTRLKLFTCSHPGHVDNPVTTPQECNTCQDYESHDCSNPDAISPSDLGRATSPPRRLSLCQQDHDPVNLSGLYRDRTAFLLCGGPSLADVDLASLAKPHIITLAVNNVAEVFKPLIWTCVDPPQSFPEPIFADHKVWKILPRGLATQFIVPDVKMVNDYPSVLYFYRNARFRPEQFLTEPSFNWGCADTIADEMGQRGARSVLLPSLKILHYLGVRRVVLLGVDFHMDLTRPYAHSETKGLSAVNANNDKYKILDTRLRALRPVFDTAGFRVLNGTPGSHLTAFDHCDYREILKEVEQES